MPLGCLPSLLERQTPLAYFVVAVNGAARKKVVVGSVGVLEAHFDVGGRVVAVADFADFIGASIGREKLNEMLGVSVRDDTPWHGLKLHGFAERHKVLLVLDKIFVDDSVGKPGIMLLLLHEA